MNLEETVQEQLDLIVSAGKVQEIIKAQLEKTLQSIISDALTSYGDFGKELKLVVNDALKINLSNVGVLEYNKIVTDIVKSELDKSLFASVIGPIQSQLSSYITDLEKTEWKLSEVIEKFTQSLKQDSSEGEITLIVTDTSYGYRHIYFDEKADKEKYQCAYQLDVNKDNKVYSFTAGAYSKVEKDIRIKPVLGSFDAFLFKLYAMECVVVIDESECETEWYEY
jgi:hypothetical protein